MNIELLLSHLHNVKRNGSGYRADCPNGHGQARGSLAISEADDGRILLHCFACNDVHGVLRALGLELADLFPERIKDASPEARRAAQEAFKRSAWGAALRVLDRESNAVLIAATMTQEGQVLPPDDMDRLVLATDRIAQAREVLT